MWNSSVTRLILVAALVVGLEGCVTETEAPPATTLSQYFYPLKNDVRYRYSRFRNIADTVSYKIKLAPGYTGPAQLIQVDPATSLPTTLYYFTLSKDTDGSPTAILTAPQEPDLIALSGELRLNSEWGATADGTITATVIDHYDEYLPSKEVRFLDVLAVTYHKQGDSEATYTLRMFAKDIGLILERRIVEGNTEIGSLQLLSWQEGN